MQMPAGNFFFPSVLSVSLLSSSKERERREWRKILQGSKKRICES